MLTPEERAIGRRTFLQAAATLPVVGAFAWANLAKARHDRPVQAGIIGAGAEGRVLLENAPQDAIQFKALCDIRPDSRGLGVEVINTRWGADPVVIKDDYRKLLERDDIEAVVIATPLWKHAEMAIAALEAGKHVLVEKTMAASIADCKAMVKAAQRSHRILQVGHQRHSNRLYHSALKMIDEGLIGDVYHIRTLWHRNDNWRREFLEIEMQDEDGALLDPGKWGYGSLEELVNWRLYRKYSQGLMGELASHQIDVINWFAGAPPTRILGSGGVYAYKDGRDEPDHIFVTLEYPPCRLNSAGLTVTFTSITTNKIDDYYEQFMGTKGTIIITGETQAMLFSEKEQKATALEVTKQPGSGGPVMKASASRTADMGAGAATAVGAAGEPLVDRLEPYMKEIEGWCSAIKYGTPVPCDSAAAVHAAVAVIAGNEAIDKKQPRELAEADYAI